MLWIFYASHYSGCKIHIPSATAVGFGVAMGRKYDQLDTDKRYVIFQLHEAVNPVERSAAWTPRRSVSVSAWWLFFPS
jgi:hypothetical protein